jgi:hypothetical protein
MKGLVATLKGRGVLGIYQRLLRLQESRKTDLSKAIAYNLKITKPFKINELKANSCQWDQMLDTHQI